MKGSMTVEMSFLMPMILMLIMSSILAAFYFHDKFKNIPALMTAKAIKHVLSGIHREGRCFFTMKGATTPKILSSFF